jgi:hypothetical protein
VPGPRHPLPEIIRFPLKSQPGAETSALLDPELLLEDPRPAELHNLARY